MPVERILTTATPVPTPYVRRFDFTSYQASNPDRPLPGTSVDAELNAVQASINSTQARLAQIQNDDGSLGNGTVGYDQIENNLFDTLTGGFLPRGKWQANTAYAISDAVNMDGILWACPVAHTSTANFAADRAAGDWMFINQPIAAQSIPCEPIGSGSGSNVQQALDYLAVQIQDLQARVLALESAP